MPTQNVFPFPRARSISCGHKFCVRDTKNVFDFFRNILCPQFPSLRARGNITSNNVSATMRPRLPVPLRKCLLNVKLEFTVIEFSFKQEPVKRVLGNYHGHRRRGTKRVRVELSDECIDVPFLASLEQMLNDSSILAQVKHNLYEVQLSYSSSKLLIGV